MARETTLFESADASVLKGYRLLQRGGANIPPMGIQRASESCYRLHKDASYQMPAFRRHIDLDSGHPLLSSDLSE
jgi:hypothetical protein